VTVIAYRARAGGELVRVLQGAAGLAVVIGLWALIASVANPVKVPSPGSVLDAARADWSTLPALSYLAFQSGGIGDALLFTTTNVLVAVGIGTAIAVPVGIAIGRYRVARDLLEPWLLVLGTVPLMVTLPFLTLWFGTARIAQWGMVIAFTFLTVVFAVRHATENVGSRFEGYAACLGASKARTTCVVTLPAIVPEALAGVRVAFAAAWGFECVAELLGVKQGIGRVIQVTAQIDSTPDLLAGVLAVGIVAVLVDATIVGIGSWVTRWKE
jgi:ABC-type nitrate/sulfonate/bicarbonate transport system permease component